MGETVIPSEARNLLFARVLKTNKISRSSSMQGRRKHKKDRNIYQETLTQATRAIGRLNRQQVASTGTVNPASAAVQHSILPIPCI